MKRVLIISPHFPPVNAPDMHRVRMSLPAFVAAGWDVTVLTVADPTPDGPVEAELAATIPAQVRIVRAHCCSRRWTRWLGVGNVALRALPFLFLAGTRLLAGRRFDVVYFSTTMFVVLPLGRIWKFLHGVPYVIDLQDPWVTDYYARPGAPRPPGGWKYGLVRKTGLLLEGWTLRQVAHLITVSADYCQVLRARYPSLQGVPFTELPFGSADHDLQHVRATLAQRPPILPRGDFRLAFAGALGPGMLTAVEVLFAAVAELKAAGQPVSVHFFGTTYSPQGAQPPATLALATKYGLQDCVHEQTARLPYYAALQVTLEADANLILGSTDLAFTPSKIMTVLAAHRPLLALAHGGSAMAARFAALGQPCVILEGDRPAPAGIRATRERLQALVRGAAPAPAAPAEFSAARLATRQMEILAGSGQVQS